MRLVPFLPAALQPAVNPKTNQASCEPEVMQAYRCTYQLMQYSTEMNSGSLRRCSHGTPMVIPVSGRNETKVKSNHQGSTSGRGQARTTVWVHVYNADSFARGSERRSRGCLPHSQGAKADKDYNIAKLLLKSYVDNKRSCGERVPGMLCTPGRSNP